MPYLHAHTEKELLLLASGGNQAAFTELYSAYKDKLYGFSLRLTESPELAKDLTQDVFLNIAGGLRIDDPALDLAVCAAIVSSYSDQPLPLTTCLAAEVGLSGEVRAVGRLEARISEAEKLGFREIYVAQAGPAPARTSKGIRVVATARLDEVLIALFS